MTGISLAVSVTTKRAVMSVRWGCLPEPGPPMRKARPRRASPLATWVGGEEEHQIALEGVEGRGSRRCRGQPARR